MATWQNEAHGLLDTPATQADGWTCLRRFCGDFDATLQHWHREGGGGQAGEPQPEAGVHIGVCLQLGNLPLQFPHPGLRQVAVLQAHPLPCTTHSIARFCFHSCAMHVQSCIQARNISVGIPTALQHTHAAEAGCR